MNKNLERIQPIIFNELNRYRTKNTIDLSRGLPFGLPKKDVLDVLKSEIDKAKNHIYDFPQGNEKLLNQIIAYYQNKFNVPLSYDNIQVLMGSKEGIYYILKALTNEGDHILIPNPHYPLYLSVANFLNLNPIFYPLNFENNFIPTIEELESLVTPKTKLIIVNYPHNPTAKILDNSGFTTFIEFAKKHKIKILYDAVYRELSFIPHATMLQFDPNMEYSIEIASMSKVFNMSGWRIAYLLAKPSIVKAVQKLKSLVDVGPFVPLQIAAAYALSLIDSIAKEKIKEYKEKALWVYSKLKEAGFTVLKPEGAFFVWVKTPFDMDSFRYMEDLYQSQNVLVIPGGAYGSEGKNFFRISVSYDINTLKKGLDGILNHKAMLDSKYLTHVGLGI